jgi:hypothetical protein
MNHAAPNVDVVFRFARDSPVEGDGFELSVPRRERGVISILAKDRRKVYGNDERHPDMVSS